VLALASGAWAGCDELLRLSPAPWRPVREGPFDIVGDGMYDAFKRWRDSLVDADRVVFEQLMRSKEPLLIHVFLATGRLGDDSRGGASAPASDKEMKRICDIHPMIGNFAPKRNGDIACDPERTKWFEETHGIPSPPEVVLHHEIFGHVLPRMGDPNIVFMLTSDARHKDTPECRALCVENRYRRQLRLPEVPPELIECLPS
jgi:hypothetical protein